MPLRILHVLSSNFFAGSVAYALQLAEWQAVEKDDKGRVFAPYSEIIVDVRLPQVRAA